MKLSFWGAARTVTGSRYIIEDGGKRLLLDCGLFQGQKELRLRNWDPFPVPPSSIDAVILTHAHIDHSGYLPLLVRNGFKGPIYCTAPTKDLCAILLPDSGHIHEEDAKRANKYGYTKHKPALPLYTEEEGRQCIKQFEVVDLGTYISITDELQFNFKRAGHILGATFVTLRNFDTRIVFSGDIGRPEAPLINAPATQQSADYLVLESTYGNRRHEDIDPKELLGEVINKTNSRGGTVVIPAFAVGRAQSLLYLIHQLKEEKAIPDLPVYLDSPMAIDATKTLLRYPAEHHLSKAECEEACHSAQYVQTAKLSKTLDQSVIPSIIIAASGMATGGRVLHHLKYFAPHTRNTILFTGFQAPGTRGDKILRGDAEVKIHGQDIPIRAHVDKLENLSAHADSEELLAWLEGFRDAPRRVFLTHGNYEAAQALGEKIGERFGWKVTIPEHGTTVDL